MKGTTFQRWGTVHFVRFLALLVLSSFTVGLTSHVQTVGLEQGVPSSHPGGWGRTLPAQSVDSILKTCRPRTPRPRSQKKSAVRRLVVIGIPIPSSVSVVDSTPPLIPSSSLVE